jgi:hypothetical protein
VTAYIRVEDIKILYPDRPLTPAVSANVLDATVARVRPDASMRIAEVELSNGRRLEVRFPDLSYTSLNLSAGARVRVTLKDGLVILDEGRAVPRSRRRSRSPASSAAGADNPDRIRPGGGPCRVSRT